MWTRVCIDATTILCVLVCTVYEEILQSLGYVPCGRDVFGDVIVIYEFMPVAERYNEWWLGLTAIFETFIEWVGTGEAVCSLLSLVMQY